MCDDDDDNNEEDGDDIHTQDDNGLRLYLTYREPRNAMQANI
jgi:hypothetical protein